MVKTMRSLILEKFPLDLRVQIELLSRRRDIQNAEKHEEFLKLLRQNNVGDIVQLGPGTNRYAIKLDGFVVKVATDHDGKIDNLKEFKMAKRLYPYVTMIHDVSDNGTLLIAEYIQPFDSFAEMSRYADRIREILKELSTVYLIGDVGITPKNFSNWGLRIGTDEPVCLDFAYIYDVSSELFLCRHCNTGSMLVPNSDFTELHCSNPACGRKYGFEDIRGRIGNDLHNHEIGDLSKEGYRLFSSNVDVELDESRSNYLAIKNKDENKKKSKQEKNKPDEVKDDGFIMPHSPRYYINNPEEDDQMSKISVTPNWNYPRKGYSYNDEGDVVIQATAVVSDADAEDIISGIAEIEEPDDEVDESQSRHKPIIVSDDIRQSTNNPLPVLSIEIAEDDDAIHVNTSDHAFLEELIRREKHHRTIALESPRYQQPKPTVISERKTIYSSDEAIDLTIQRLDETDRNKRSYTADVMKDDHPSGHNLKQYEMDYNMGEFYPNVEIPDYQPVDNAVIPVQNIQFEVEIASPASATQDTEDEIDEEDAVVSSDTTETKMDETVPDVSQDVLSKKFRKNVRQVLSKFSNRVGNDLHIIEAFDDVRDAMKDKKMLSGRFYEVVQNAVFNSLTVYMDLTKVTVPNTNNAGTHIEWQCPDTFDEKIYPTLIFLDRMYNDSALGRIDDPYDCREKYQELYDDHDGIQKEWLPEFKKILKNKLPIEAYGVDDIADIVAKLWCAEEVDQTEPSVQSTKPEETDTSEVEDSPKEKVIMASVYGGPCDPKDIVESSEPEVSGEIKESEGTGDIMTPNEDGDMTVNVMGSMNNHIKTITEAMAEAGECGCDDCDDDHPEEAEPLVVRIYPEEDGGTMVRIEYGDAYGPIIIPIYTSFQAISEYASTGEDTIVAEHIDRYNGVWNWLKHLIPDMVFEASDPEKWLKANESEDETDQTRIVVLGQDNDKYYMGAYQIEAIYVMHEDVEEGVFGTPTLDRRTLELLNAAMCETFEILTKGGHLSHLERTLARKDLCYSEEYMEEITQWVDDDNDDDEEEDAQDETDESNGAISEAAEIAAEFIRNSNHGGHDVQSTDDDKHNTYVDTSQTDVIVMDNNPVDMFVPNDDQGSSEGSDQLSDGELAPGVYKPLRRVKPEEDQ